MRCYFCDTKLPPPPKVVHPEDDEAYERWLEAPCAACQKGSQRDANEIAGKIEDKMRQE
jgi:hypothetical protein